jgi:hypothetical protein
VKVVKTTFEEEQKVKEEAWLNLTGEERLAIAARIINTVRDPLVNYSLKGKKVKITRLS